MKVIAVQRGLEHIKDQLNLLGYQTVFYDEINSPIDALVYFEENNTYALTNINQHLSQQYMSQDYFQHPGTILINAKDKSIDDIIQIIEKRLYSPLF